MPQVQQHVAMKWTFSNEGVRLTVDFAADEMTVADFKYIADQLRRTLDGGDGGDSAGEQEDESEAPASGDGLGIGGSCRSVGAGEDARVPGGGFLHASGALYDAHFVRIK